MISLGHMCIDGTKIKANASNYSAVTRDNFSKLKELVERELEEGIRVDEERTGYTVIKISTSCLITYSTKRYLKNLNRDTILEVKNKKKKSR